MIVAEYIDKVDIIDFDEIKDLIVEDLIYLFHAKKYKRLYILKNSIPIFILDPLKIVDLFLNKNYKKKVKEIISDNNYIRCFEYDKHLIDAYYEMRRDKLEYMPVCKDGKLIGEINFSILSLKISYIVIKDELTGVFNKKYFDVILEEYNDFNKPMGLIFVEIKDLMIYEGLYGEEIVYKTFKKYAEILKSSLRDIDFIFRIDNQFRIITFNDLEITIKIVERIKNRLNEVEVNGIHIPYKISFSHIPEMSHDIISAVEECERKLIEGD